jgi:hypothetical protein
MESSPADALLLLRKWRDETSPVFVFFTVASVAVFGFGGRVTECDERAITFRGDVANRLSLRPEAIVRAEYADPRDVKTFVTERVRLGGMESALKLYLKNDHSMIVVEYGEAP